MQRSVVLLVAGVAVVGAALLAWWLTRGTEVIELPVAPRTEQADAPAVRHAEGLATRPILARPFDPAADPDEPSAATIPMTNPNDVSLAGKVVDERRRPIADAAIEVSVEGRDTLSAKSGADGRFRIDLGPGPALDPLRGIVQASDKRGFVAFKDFSVEPRQNVTDLGTFALLDGGALSVRVLKDGAGVPGARVFIGRRHWLGFGPVVTDASGMVGPRRLPHGWYVVTAFLGDAFRSEVKVDIPRRDAAPLDLILTPAWRLLVTLKDAATASPVEGARLEVTSTVRTSERAITMFDATTARPIPPTDANGQSVIAGLSHERPVTVTVIPCGVKSERPRFDEQRHGTAKPGEEELVITFAQGEVFTFPIVPDETEGPPDGAELKLSVPEGYAGAPPPPKGKVAGRNVVIDRVTERGVNFLATADDGSMAILRILGDARKTKVGSDAKFKKPRTLTLSAHERGGKPLTGYVVQVHNPGNVRRGSTTSIDAQGNARIEGLYPQRVDVRISRPDVDRWLGKVVGSLDLTKPGDAQLDVILERERDCIVHVTVDGEKRLPASFSLRIAGAEAGPMRATDTAMGPIEEDPDEAVLRFKMRPDPAAEKLRLFATARGSPQVTVDLPPIGDATVIETSVAFLTGAKARIHVLPPSDNLHEVGLQRYITESSTWSQYGNPGMSSESGELGKKPTEIALDALPAGRYRARDALTGVVSKAADIEVGGNAEFTVDLTRAGPITGRLEGPADGDFGAGSVVVEGADVSRPGAGLGIGDGISVRLNSEFKLRVPGDRPVILRAKHPLLVPSPDAGSATITAPGGSVLLKLVRGAEATFRIAGAPDRESRQFPRDRILLFAGEPEGEPAQTCEVHYKDGVGRFGGYKAGSYTLWCDIPPASPLILRDVTLGDAVTDLGELTLPEGATVRVKVLPREGQDPRVDVSATPFGAPRYRRSAMSRGGGDLLLRGLGPGRFKIEIRAGDAFGTPKQHEVDSTGSGEIPLTVDLR